jgi:hypothetical protein
VDRARLVSLVGGRAKRLAWIVNHRTLMEGEIPVLRGLGYEIFVPKVTPSDDPEYRSGAVTYEYDETLSLPLAALAVLNEHDFYRRTWSPTLTTILNRYFDVVVTSLSLYTTPLEQAVRRFHGTVVARVFGREHPRRYTEFLPATGASALLPAIAAMGPRFVFGQAFENLADIEDTTLRDRATTITVPLPRFVSEHRDTWTGVGRDAVLLCPAILDSVYYGERYDDIKRSFGSLPHVIFGRQHRPVDDPHVVGYVSDDDLVELYARAPVFLYPSTEPRHVHYSPLEAMVVGTPVLYRRGGLIDLLAGRAALPGSCASADEMRDKAAALLAGDRTLADEIRAKQPHVLCHFSDDLASRQWASALGTADGV